MNTAAIYIKKESNESYHITLSNSKKIICRNIVMATGGNPHKPISKISMNNSDIDISVYSGKNVSSDMIIKGCFDEQLKKLKEKDLNIVILGGSHSAFSVAHYLLNTIRLGKGSIKIWANTKPKIFYNTTKEALADGYSDFTNDDVCPVTNRLYRLAGLRMDGKNLYRKILGLEKDIEKRVCLHLLEEDHKILKYDLEKADVIIHAIGYEFNPTPFFNENDEPVKFAGSETGNWVNDHCEMIDGRGNRLENIFAMGLASGFIPKGKLGGEPSFKGQTNGIWYYQNLIAEIILREILHKKTVNMQGLELAPPIR